MSQSNGNDRQSCDVCGGPSTTIDGICNAYLCDGSECLDVAWDVAFPPGSEGQS